MPHTLTAKEQSLGQIFGGDYVLTIPCYQRPYAWGKEQVQELLDDFVYALAIAPEQLSEAEPYFLGSIVLIKSATRPDATVVDGQQRLNTLTLLLFAIRGLLNDAVIQSDITSHIYEKGCIAKGTQGRYADRVNKHLRCLNQLEFKDWVPPALIFLVRYRNQPESTVRFFGRLERLANSMLESKYGVKERVECFSALTTAIENGLKSGAADHAIIKRL